MEHRTVITFMPMMQPGARRKLTYLLVALIMLACTSSAYLGVKAGHNARAASTFFAGLSFSILFWTRIPRNQE